MNNQFELNDKTKRKLNSLRLNALTEYEDGLASSRSHMVLKASSVLAVFMVLGLVSFNVFHKPVEEVAFEDFSMMSEEDLVYVLTIEVDSDEDE